MASCEPRELSRPSPFSSGSSSLPPSPRCPMPDLGSSNRRIGRPRSYARCRASRALRLAAFPPASLVSGLLVLSTIAACLPLASSETDGVPSIPLGLCGIWSNRVNFGIFPVAVYAAKVGLAEGLFDDFLNTSNFTVSINPVETACSTTGVSQKMLPMLLGQGTQVGRLHSDTEVDPVVAVIGCGCSGPATIASQLAAPLNIPMVSPSATAPALSNKDLHPYFTRVVPPDSKQGAGLATMVRVLGAMSADGWTRVTLIYPAETYSEGIAEVFAAAETLSSVTIIKESIPAIETLWGFTDENYATMKETLLRVADADPFPRVLVFPSHYWDLHALVIMLEIGLYSEKSALIVSDGMVGNGYAEAQRVAEVQTAYNDDPSSVSDDEAAFLQTKLGNRDWNSVLLSLHGILGLKPTTQGSMVQSAAFKAFWAGLTPEKLYQAGFPESFTMDDSYFEEDAILDHTYCPYFFDATVAIFVAISKMLAGGSTAEEVAGADLLSAILDIRFEGLTGPISLDESGDRLGTYSVINMFATGPVTIGEYDAIEDVITFASEPIFPSNSTTVPRDRPAACSPGYQSNANDCEACGPGSFSPSAGSSCTDCPEGTYTASSGSSTCETAIQGTYVSGEGSTEALLCPRGEYSSTVGAAACIECQAGFFASVEGSTSCDWCSEGSYSGEEGSSECEICSNGRTTVSVGSTSNDACVCQAGYFQPESSEECASCPEGMVCEMGSDMARLDEEAGVFPKAKPGFMTLASDPLQAYRCLTESNCPGGAPGVCKDNRDGEAIACAECLDDYYQDGEECRQCSGGQDYLVFVVVAIACAVVIVLATFLITKDSLSQTHGAAFCAVSLGLFVTGLQTLGIFAQLALTWIDPIKAILRLAILFSFNLDILKTSCIFGSDPVGHFGLRLLVLPCVVPIVGIATWFRRGNLAFLPQLTNTLGTYFNVFFISIVVSSTVPFVCYSHPGGERWSMRNVPSVLCFEGSEFITMAILGGLSFLLIAVPFMCLSLHGIRKYPVLIRRHDSYEILQGLRFLYVKFVPEAYFYGPVMLVRSMAVSLVPVILTDAASQILSLCVILLLFLILQVWLRPWRGVLINACDAATSAVLVTLLLTGAMLADIGSSDDAITAINVLVIIAFGAILLSLLATILQYFTASSFDKYSMFICHHKGSAAAQARLLKLSLAIGSTSVFIDSDDLNDLDFLFDIVKTKVERLVVYLTRDTLRRPWCAGEITTAFKASKARVVSIVLPTFSPPSLEELQDLSAYVDESGCSLRQYGICWDAVRESFNMLLDSTKTPCITLGNAPSSVRKYQQLADTVAKGVSCDMFQCSSEGCDPISAEADQVVVSADRTDDEAVAAAGILVRKLQERIFHREGRNSTVCSLVEKNEEDNVGLGHCVASARASIVLLSRDSLLNVGQLSVIVNATRCRAERGKSREEAVYGLVPMMLPGFDFPTENFYESVLARSIVDNVEESKTWIRAFFKLIVTFFPTHGSDSALDMEVDKVLGRIPAAPASVSKTKTDPSFISLVGPVRTKTVNDDDGREEDRDKVRAEPTDDDNESVEDRDKDIRSL